MSTIPNIPVPAQQQPGLFANLINILRRKDSKDNVTADSVSHTSAMGPPVSSVDQVGYEAESGAAYYTESNAQASSNRQLGRQHSLDAGTPLRNSTPHQDAITIARLEPTLPSPMEFRGIEISPDLPPNPEDIKRIQEALMPSPFQYEQRKTQRQYNVVNSQVGGVPVEGPVPGSDVDELTELFFQATTNSRVQAETLLQEAMATENMLAAANSGAMLGFAQMGYPASTGEMSSFMQGQMGGTGSDEDTSSTATSNKPKYVRKLCSVEGCQNLSRSKGLCKSHGGGRRCSVEGCPRASQSGNLCIAHGGGKRCQVDGCSKAAQSRGLCKAHGGGVRCSVPGCNKSSQGDGLCRTHGGGKRCSEPGCKKWAQRAGKCMVHSGQSG